MWVDPGGTVVLTKSVFHLNPVATGIVNLGGEVRCGEMECLPVCTACELVPSPVPTANPTASPSAPAAVPSALPTSANKTERNVVISVSAVILLACGVAIAKLKRRFCCKSRAATNDDVTEPLVTTVERDLAQFSEHGTRGSSNPSYPGSRLKRGSIELSHDATTSHYSLPPSVMESSPSPILVARHDMRIIIWSTGEWCNEQCYATDPSCV